MNRVRILRDRLAKALVATALPGRHLQIVNRGADIRQPKAFFEVEIGDHAYTITITEDR